MSKKAVIENLKVVLADSYALYLKTQNYHWNVTGPHFKSLHLLFEEQYTDLQKIVDEIAELIRTLGEKVPASFSIFNSNKNIGDGDENLSAEDMVKEIKDDQHVIISTLNLTLKSAQEVGDESVIAMIVDRISVHQKNAWMLESSL